MELQNNNEKINDYLKKVEQDDNKVSVISEKDKD